MGEKWICSNCGAENTLKFCTKCGTPKPVIEAPVTEEAIADGNWDCICGRIGNTAKFCSKCGRPRAEGAVIAAAAVAAAEVAAAVVPEAEIPEVDIPEVEIPEVEMPEVELPEMEVPEVEIPEIEIPEAETPEVEIPEVELPEVEIPEAEIPEMEVPEVEIPEEIVPELVLPEAEVPQKMVPTLEIPEPDNTWTCACGQTGNAGKFCRSCGSPRPSEDVIPAAVAAGTVAATAPEVEIPEVEIPEMAAPEVEVPKVEMPQEVVPKLELPGSDSTWDCTCGQTGNAGKFCRNCGLPRPEAAPAPALAPAEGPWDCACGKTGNLGKFCSVCGTPREQGFAPAGMTEPQLKAPEIPQPETPAETGKKKKTPKTLWIIIAAAVVVVAAIIVALIFLLPKKYTVNEKPQAEVLEVKEEFSLFVDKDRDISFLYPDDLLADRGTDGDRIYGGEKEQYPYVLIDRVNETTKPKDYFKQYQESLKQQYGDLDFSDIQEVEVEGKTVYTVQTYLPSEGGNVDQYLELYEDCYITYTAKGYNSSTENRELYYAIGSLRTSADAYPVPQALLYENEMGNFSVEVLPDYVVQEFAGGLYAEKGNAGQFVTYMNTDTVGALVYDREDFLTRADMMNEYVENIIGVNALEITGDATTEIYNGKDFLVYPVKMELRNGSEAVGKLCIGDCDYPFGCYIMCYYLEKNSGSLQEEEGEAFLASMNVHGNPNIREFVVKDLTGLGYGMIAIRADLVGSIEIKEEDDLVEITNPEGNQKIVIEYLEGSSLYDDIASKIAQELADKYKTAYLAEIQPPEEGRYYMNACEITYTNDKDVKHVYRIYCVNSTSDHKFCIDYDVEEGKEDWAKEVCDYLFWSWKLK